MTDICKSCGNTAVVYQDRGDLVCLNCLKKLTFRLDGLPGHLVEVNADSCPEICPLCFGSKLALDDICHRCQLEQEWGAEEYPEERNG